MIKSPWSRKDRLLALGLSHIGERIKTKDLLVFMGYTSQRALYMPAAQKKQLISKKAL